MEPFFQNPPKLKNQYENDLTLKNYLKRKIPHDILSEIEPDLNNFGERVVSDILDTAYQAESSEPELIQFDAWGNRIDEIKISESWQKLNDISATEGLVAIGYERKYSEFSRIYQFAKLYLFHPSSAVYTCPLAMTDGAARILELHGDLDLKNNALQNLISRDPEKFWTSGQWMTEKTGGSDVGISRTIAKLVDGEYKLYGDKWFTSATTSQMTLTLARIVDEQGNSISGGRGLSLFYLETRDKNDKLNNITLHRLKDKLGTKSLPTAELTLNGSKAKLISDSGNGIKKISQLLNITRIYNSISAVGFMRRALALSKDYADKRIAFGKKLAEHPLHYETLANLQVEYEGAFNLVFFTVELLGKVECNKATEIENSLLRLLTPITKLYTAKQALKIISEVLESFGGAGYVENTKLPVLLRDAQVLSIWEGTTNILSLDTLRAIEKENVMEPFFNYIETNLGKINNLKLSHLIDQVLISVKKLKAYYYNCIEQDNDFVQAGARNFSFSISRTFIALLLIEQADWELNENKNDRGLYVVERWCKKELTPLIYPDQKHREISSILGIQS